VERVPDTKRMATSGIPVKRTDADGIRVSTVATVASGSRRKYWATGRFFLGRIRELLLHRLPRGWVSDRTASRPTLDGARSK